MKNKGKNSTLKTAILVVDVTDTIVRIQFCMNFMRKGMRADLILRGKV